MDPADAPARENLRLCTLKLTARAHRGRGIRVPVRPNSRDA
jgi:hypothetical protein